MVGHLILLRFLFFYSFCHSSFGERMVGGRVLRVIISNQLYGR